jgi:hypothetical protein
MKIPRARISGPYGVRQAAVSDNIFNGKPRVTNHTKIPVTLNSSASEP